MKITADVFVYLTALLHFGFMILESILWTKPLGLKTFQMTEANARATEELAKNQGVYNGFLAAGLIYANCAGHLQMLYFLLGCVIVAGIVGALTVNKKIFFVQSIPAILALVFACVA